jgi:acyl-CoA thioesterase-1
MTYFSLARPLAVALILTASNVARAESELPVTIFNIGDSLITSSGIYPPSDKFRAVLEQALTGDGHSVKVIDAPFQRLSEHGLDWIQSTVGLEVMPANTAVILELGSNDCNSGVTLDQTKANLDLILEALSKKHIPALLVGTTASETCGAEYAAAYPQIFTELSIRYDVLLYTDFMTGITGHSEFLQSDQAHPNAAGMLVVVQNMLQSVDALIARVRQQ